MRLAAPPTRGLARDPPRGLPVEVEDAAQIVGHHEVAAVVAPAEAVGVARGVELGHDAARVGVEHVGEGRVARDGELAVVARPRRGGVDVVLVAAPRPGARCVVDVVAQDPAIQTERVHAAALAGEAHHVGGVVDVLSAQLGTYAAALPSGSMILITPQSRPPSKPAPTRSRFPVRSAKRTVSTSAVCARNRRRRSPATAPRRG